MKLKIYKEKKEKGTVHFRLFEDTNQISLAAVDEEGVILNCGIILSITEKGIILHPNVNKDINLPLDRNKGSVKKIR